MHFKNLAVFLLLVASFGFAKAQDSTNVPIVGFDHVEQLLQPKNNDTTYVVNFWATWCRPCVKELPYITNLETKYAGKKIKVFLVSLDFKKNYDKMLEFLQKRNISTSAVLLSAPDANAWIDKVDKSWSGAIPATVIFNNSKRSFYEKEFHEEDLYKTIETFF
jgi:thiol-disulfide isomerase/thioredoxin